MISIILFLVQTARQKSHRLLLTIESRQLTIYRPVSCNFGKVKSGEVSLFKIIIMPV